MTNDEKAWTLKRFAHILAHLPDDVRPVAILLLTKEGNGGFCTLQESENFTLASETIIMQVAERLIAGDKPMTERI